MDEQYVLLSLPSKCLTYEDTEPDGIKIRTFKGKEQQLVAELTPVNIKKKFLTIISNVIQGIEPQKLTSGDARYIMMWEAINSYTNMYPLKLVCETCLQEVELSIDLGDLDSKELPNDFKQPYEVELSDRKIFLRLLTLEDEVNTLEMIRKGQSSYLYNYALSIVDKDVNIVDRVKMLEEMSTADLGKIEDFHIKFDHGPDLNAKYVCPLCEGEGRVLIPFRLDRLLSFRKES